MLDFEIIQRATQTEDTDLSINLANQTVVVPGTHGRIKRVKRTIYRAKFEGKTLIGNLHKRDSDNPWPVYMFNPTQRHWVPRETIKLPKDTRTREQRIHSAEQQRERRR